jgi:signal transduction histidine kinase
MRMLLAGVLPRRTVRMRLTALYGALFVACGAVLLAIASGVVVSSSRMSVAPANQAVPSPLTRDQIRIHQLQDELATVESQLHSGLSHGLLVGSAIALGVMTVVSVVLGWIVAGRVLRPLRLMTAATRRISADSLHERLAVTGPGDELKDLADTIDGLLARLEGAFTAQRRFVANASHELRTPLTTMRASVDVAVAKPGPVPAQTIAWRAGCAANWTGWTACSTGSWRSPGRSTATCPARPRSRWNTSSPRRSRRGPARSPPGT